MLFRSTSIHKNILEGNFSLSYQAENQINVLSLTLSENSLQVNNFNSNLNQFTIQNTYHLDKIKEENFLGIPSSFIKIIQFVNLENKLSSSPTKSKLKI